MSDDDIVQLAEWRVRKEQRSYFPSDDKGKCQHFNLTMDKHGFTVRCDDCRLQLSAYWVLERMLDSYRKAQGDIQRDREAHRERVSGDIRLLAARTVDRAWQSRHMVPACPHCCRGILPTDGFGSAMTSKEIEIARRKRQPQEHPERV